MGPRRKIDFLLYENTLSFVKVGFSCNVANNCGGAIVQVDILPIAYV
jgi:hypothetical protein